MGALRTPEVFVLDRQHVIRYWGRIDDQFGFRPGGGYAKPKQTERNLADAIQAVVEDKSVIAPVAKADGCLIGRVTKTAPHGSITYSQQISRIFQNRCQRCHRPDEIAPFSMMTYDEVVGWGAMIREVVSEGRMPPWYADPKYGHFSNDARLTAEEKEQICAWVDNGCPEGDPKDLPPVREYSTNWQMGEPDQIVYMSNKPHTVPAEGAVEYQYFSPSIPVGPPTSGCKPPRPAPATDRSYTISASIFSPGSAKDAFPREGIGAYVPGNVPNIWQPGTAVYVPAGSRLLFELHYTPNGNRSAGPQHDRTSLCRSKTVKKIVRCTIVNERALRIPPGQSRLRGHRQASVRQGHELLILWPHMHLRGKSFRFEAEYPDGNRETLLNVPNYDFNWQYRYVLDKPKRIPKGTTLGCIARFDNSAENLANPDPTQEVMVGESTSNEMMQGNYYSLDAQPDAACIALVALAQADNARPTAAPSAESKPSDLLADELRPLIDAGAESSQEALATAKSLVEQLRLAHPHDRRIDYAYALVLINQGEYAAAGDLLARYAAAGEIPIGAECARVWLRTRQASSSAAIDDMESLAGRFATAQTSSIGTSDEYHAAAHFLGQCLGRCAARRRTRPVIRASLSHAIALPNDLARPFAPISAPASAKPTRGQPLPRASTPRKTLPPGSRPISPFLIAPKPAAFLASRRISRDPTDWPVFSRVFCWILPALGGSKEAS